MNRMSMKERFDAASAEVQSSPEVRQGLKNFLRAKDEISRAVDSWRDATQTQAREKGSGMNIDDGFIDSIEDQKQSAVDVASEWVDYAHQMFEWFEGERLTDEEQEFVQNTLDEIDAMANMDDEWNHLLNSTIDSRRQRQKVA